MQHYFLRDSIQDEQRLILPNDISNHFLRVLRAKPGQEVELVSRDHVVFLAKLIGQKQSQAEVLIEHNLHKNVELPVSVTIVCGLSKKNKPEFIVQKATELGANEIIFLPMKWSIAKWDAGKKRSKKLMRLNEVALNAAEQSHRNVIPKVSYAESIKKLNLENFTTKIVAYEESAKQNEESNLITSFKKTKRQSHIVALFGPEGGISSPEIDELTAQHFVLCGLGPRIMRTETAPLYFLSAVSTFFELS